MLRFEQRDLGRVPAGARAQLPPAGAPLPAQARRARSRCPTASPPTPTGSQRDMDTLFALHRAALGRRRDAVPAGGGVPPRVRGAGAREGVAAAVVPRGRRAAGRRALRLPLRRRRVGLPGRARPGLRRPAGRLRAARPRGARGARRRHGRVPAPARRRGLQGAVRDRRPRPRDLRACRAAPRRGPCSRAALAARGRSLGLRRILDRP